MTNNRSSAYEYNDSAAYGQFAEQAYGFTEDLKSQPAINATIKPLQPGYKVDVEANKLAPRVRGKSLLKLVGHCAIFIVILLTGFLALILGRAFHANYMAGGITSRFRG